MAKLVVGINDLATLHPEIAAEADGWDPCTSTSGNSSKKVSWKCEKGHTWNALVSSRTKQGHGCPYCTNRKVWIGFNDLKTKFPEIAKEAHGWDPSKFLPGIAKKMSWKCEKGHTWETTLTNRTKPSGTSCPYCTNHKVWIGFNDLATLHPEVAKEANGWDPSKFLPGTVKKCLGNAKKVIHGILLQTHERHRKLVVLNVQNMDLILINLLGFI
jgi:hypothetical protein